MQFGARLSRACRSLLRESQRSPLSLHRPRLAAQLADRLRFLAYFREQKLPAERMRSRRLVIIVVLTVDTAAAAAAAVITAKKVACKRRARKSMD